MDTENNLNVLLASDTEFYLIFSPQNSCYAIIILQANGELIETELMNFEHISIIEKENFLIWLNESCQDAYTFNYDISDKASIAKAISNLKLKNEETKEMQYQDIFDENLSSFVIGEEKIKLEGNFNCSLQGYNSDRTFVFMGNNILVYKISTDYENALEYVSKIPIIQEMPSPITNPILFNSEKNVLFTNEDSKMINKTDLETGKIVETYQIPEKYPIEQITNQAKNSQKSPESQFLAISESSILKFDTRTQDPISSIKSYKTSKLFSCIKTSFYGGLALGSYNGEIRLCKNSDAKKATSLCYGFGDAINGIDITLDGKWVLATCDKYLILIPTTYEDNSNILSELQIQEKKRKTIIKLALAETDLQKYKLQKHNFTYATFNNGDTNSIEESIVTSIGDYIIMWNFAKVKKGKITEYTVKQLVDRVIANQFRFNDQSNLLVTLPKTVKVEKRIRSITKN